MKMCKRDALRAYPPEQLNPETLVAQLLSAHPSIEHLELFYERTCNLAWPETWGESPWPFASAIAYRIRNHPDPIAHLQQDMTKRQNEQISGGRAYSTYAIDQRELDALHALAAREPDNARTWGASTDAHDINACFEAWRRTGVDHEALQAVLPDLLDSPGPVAGRHYEHGLFIEAPKPGRYFLMLANCEYESTNLRALEVLLFRWAHDEGYFDPRPAPQLAAPGAG